MRAAPLDVVCHVAAFLAHPALAAVCRGWRAALWGRHVVLRADAATGDGDAGRLIAHTVRVLEGGAAHRLDVDGGRGGADAGPLLLAVAALVATPHALRSLRLVWPAAPLPAPFQRSAPTSPDAAARAVAGLLNARAAGLRDLELDDGGGEGWWDGWAPPIARAGPALRRLRLRITPAANPLVARLLWPPPLAGLVDLALTLDADVARHWVTRLRDHGLPHLTALALTAVGGSRPVRGCFAVEACLAAVRACPRLQRLALGTAGRSAVDLPLREASADLLVRRGGALRTVDVVLAHTTATVAPVPALLALLWPSKAPAAVRVRVAPPDLVHVGWTDDLTLAQLPQRPPRALRSLHLSGAVLADHHMLARWVARVAPLAVTVENATAAAPRDDADDDGDDDAVWANSAVGRP